MKTGRRERIWLANKSVTYVTKLYPNAASLVHSVTLCFNLFFNARNVLFYPNPKIVKYKGHKRLHWMAIWTRSYSRYEIATVSFVTKQSSLSRCAFLARFRRLRLFHAVRVHALSVFVPAVFRSSMKGTFLPRKSLRNREVQFHPQVLQ